MVGISRNPREFLALFRCRGLANAVNSTTVLSRCFPENPGIAKYRRPLFPEEERTFLPDDGALGLSMQEQKDVIRVAAYVRERGYLGKEKETGNEQQEIQVDTPQGAGQGSDQNQGPA